MKRTIKIPLYHTAIQVRVVADIGRCAAKIHKQHNEALHEDYTGCRGLSFSFSNDVHFVLLNAKELTPGLIAHEISHAIDDIINHAGSTEVDRGYLTEMVTDEVYKFVKVLAG